jgi:hypothetical protein
MLLATVLAGLLMGGVILMTSTIARDRARVAADEAKSRRAGAIVEQIRWDLVNAQTMTPQGNGRILVLIGHGGLDAQTLAPTNRLTQVVYEVRGRGREAALFRAQKYLDEPTRPEPWAELVCADVQALSVIPESGDAEPVEREKPPALVVGPDDPPPPLQRRGPQAYFVPTRAVIHLQHGPERIDQEVWLR